MHYRLVFDIADVGYQSWWFPAAGLLFIGVGILMRRYRRLLFQSRPGKTAGLMDRWFLRVWLGFAVLWTAGAFALTYAEYRSALNALRTGHLGVVEGRVEHFAPSPYQAHEPFTVAGHRFSYSDNGIQAGFHNTSSHGGPIREGLQVRVTYVDNGTRWDNEIVRLEIGE